MVGEANSRGLFQRNYSPFAVLVCCVSSISFQLYFVFMISFCACVCCCFCSCVFFLLLEVTFLFVVFFYSPWKYFCTSLLLLLLSSIWGVYTNWGLFFIQLWVACAKFKSSHLKIINNCINYNNKPKRKTEKHNLY